MIQITLPWPPSKLSGHANMHHQTLGRINKKYRQLAVKATEEALSGRTVAATPYDIRVSAVFYPPDNRGDRLNFSNRLKPYWDGVAEAMGVNDKRFLPGANHYAQPVKNDGCVVLLIDAPIAEDNPTDTLRNQLKASLLMEE